MKENKDGLYNKYNVERVDDSEKHQGCDYFVLDLTHDKYARLALAAYALNCLDDYPQLAADLRAKMTKLAETIPDNEEN